jgi:hypothetical protein
VKSIEVVDLGLKEAFDDVSVLLGDVVVDGVGDPGEEAVKVWLSYCLEGDMVSLSLQLAS